MTAPTAVPQIVEAQKEIAAFLEALYDHYQIFVDALDVVWYYDEKEKRQNVGQIRITHQGVTRR